MWYDVHFFAFYSLFRHKLFNSENCLEHIPGTGEDFLSWKEKLSSEEKKKMSAEKCTSYFIEPVQWMASSLTGTVEGKVCVVTRSAIFPRLFSYHIYLHCFIFLSNLAELP